MVQHPIAPSSAMICVDSIWATQVQLAFQVPSPLDMLTSIIDADSCLSFDNFSLSRRCSASSFSSSCTFVGAVNLVTVGYVS